MVMVKVETPPDFNDSRRSVLGLRFFMILRFFKPAGK
jgi:hypothetical protein